MMPLNLAISDKTQVEAVRKFLRVGTPSLTQTNRDFYQILRNGPVVGY